MDPNRGQAPWSCNLERPTIGYPLDPEGRLAGLMKREGDQTSVTLAASLVSFVAPRENRREWSLDATVTLAQQQMHFLVCLAKTVAES